MHGIFIEITYIDDDGLVSYFGIEINGLQLKDGVELNALELVKKMLPDENIVQARFITKAAYESKYEDED